MAVRSAAAATPYVAQTGRASRTGTHPPQQTLRLFNGQLIGIRAGRRPVSRDCALTIPRRSLLGPPDSADRRRRRSGDAGIVTVPQLGQRGQRLGIAPPADGIDDPDKQAAFQVAERSAQR